MKPAADQDLEASQNHLGKNRGSNDHTNMRILQRIVSGIPLVLSLATRMQKPHAFVVFGSPNETLFFLCGPLFSNSSSSSQKALLVPGHAKAYLAIASQYRCPRNCTENSWRRYRANSPPHINHSWDPTSAPPHVHSKPSNQPYTTQTYGTSQPSRQPPIPP